MEFFYGQELLWYPLISVLPSFPIFSFLLLLKNFPKTFFILPCFCSLQISFSLEGTAFRTFSHNTNETALHKVTKKKIHLAKSGAYLSSWQ